MSRSRDLLRHIAQLRDIRNIMNSMKNLAFIETRKLERFIYAQRQVVENITAIAEDFLAVYPCPPPAAQQQPRMFVLMGSERGFCGDFNEQLLNALDIACPQTASYSPAEVRERDVIEIIGVGRKLCGRLETTHPTAMQLEGADVAEEIPVVLNRLLTEIAKQQAKHPALTVSVLYQDAQRHQVTTAELLPPFQQCGRPAKTFGVAPQLNLEPAALLRELIEHYLFAILHEIFYTSLMAENHRRLQHMQGAIQHLERRTETLKRRHNILRQEEITEEIEVLLMTAESLDSAAMKKRAFLQES